MAFNLEINHEGDNNTARGPFGNNWEGQTFTTVGGFTLTRCSFWMFETGTSPDATLYIYATAAGVPTGSALGQGTITTAMVGGSPAWIDVDLDSGVALSATTQYAFVLANPSGGVVSRFSWYLDTTSPAYSGGTRVYSSNGGSSWSSDATDDVNFRLYSGSAVDYVDMVGTGGLTFGSTASMTNDITMIGTSSLTFGSTATLTYGPLSGTKSEKYKSIIVACGNDSMYIEDV